jgi:antitoxin component YwqK of YwqJK toxin-antitoxin module
MSTAHPSPPAAAGPIVVEQRDASGALTSRTEFKDGAPHGQMTGYGPNGKPAMQATYAAGILDGSCRLWDDKGDLVQEAAYRKGKQHGMTRVYARGALLSEQMFVNGLPQGDTTFYSEAGLATCKMKFHAGAPEGEALFMNDGQVVRSAHYRKGLLEGETVDYDRDGAKVQSAVYKANLLDGWLRRYWPNGQVMEEMLYRQGKPAGEPKRFSSKGAEQTLAASQASLMQRLEKLVRG